MPKVKASSVKASKGKKATAAKAKRLKIVCLGGGTQIPPLLLGNLKKHPAQITGITSMVDCGGSGGYFRKKFNVLPASDIRRHILALSNAPEWKKDMWKFRFGEEVFEDGHKGQVFANAFMAGLETSFKDYRKVIEFVSQFMELGDNRALPAIVEQAHILAELENGEIIKGEAEIDVPREHDPNLKIKRVFLDPAVKLFPDARKAILEANLIIIGPGDLYSSIIPCLLVEGTPTVFRKTKAKKILICNALTKQGETQGFSVARFADEVEKYMGSRLDYVLYHNRKIPQEQLTTYQKDHPQILGTVKIDGDLPEKKFIGRDIYQKNEVAYDSKKVISEIFKLAKK